MASFLPMALALLTQTMPPVSSPTLHHRASYQVSEPSAPVLLQSNAARLPQDATGFYRFRDRSQGIQIATHEGRVSGFVLKFAEGKSDKGLVVGYFFGNVTADHERLSFTTQEVHGVWYAFDGKLVFGSRLNPLQPGYYILEGKLTAHDEQQQTTREASIRLPSSGSR
jgi:hypothetical protein